MKTPYTLLLATALLPLMDVMLPGMCDPAKHRPKRPLRPVILRLVPSELLYNADPGNTVGLQANDALKSQVDLYGENFLPKSVICAEGFPVKTQYVSSKHMRTWVGALRAHPHNTESGMGGSMYLHVYVTVRNPGKKPLRSRVVTFTTGHDGGGGG